jgi:hypothetical protein
VQKAAITDDRVRRSIDLAEEAVAVDPFHRSRRHDADGITFDLNEPGVILGYVVEGEEVVYLRLHVLY